VHSDLAALRDAGHPCGEAVLMDCFDRGFWNDGEKKHAFHMGESRFGEDKGDAQFLAFPEPLTWRGDVICDGAPAQNRSKWLMENKGMMEVQCTLVLCCSVALTQPSL